MNKHTGTYSKDNKNYHVGKETTEVSVLIDSSTYEMDRSVQQLMNDAAELMEECTDIGIKISVDTSYGNGEAFLYLTGIRPVSDEDISAIKRAVKEREESNEIRQRKEYEILKKKFENAI